MVKKFVLNKLSDKELEKYIAPNSRFTSEAIKLAFEILNERSFTFSEEEMNRINSLIKTKIENERKENLLDSNLVYPNHTEAKELFTKTFIVGVSIFGTFVFGSYYLYCNFKILNKINKKAIIALLLFTGFSILVDVITLPFLHEHQEEITEVIRRNTIITRLHEKYFYLIISFLIRLIYSLTFIDFIWRKFIGKDLKYKEKTELI